MERPLLLNGFMATGKTTVGRRVSEWCGRPFVDLDAYVEQRAGKSVERIFKEDGETAFRRLEREVLLQCLDTEPRSVIAVGGGALLHRPTRLIALDRAVVVTLTATPRTIVERSHSAPVRPLLAVDAPLERAEELLLQREAAYAECHARVSTETGTADDAAQAVISIWQRDPIAVAAGENSYAVEIGDRTACDRLTARVGEASLGLLVTDRNVAAHHADGAENAIELAGIPSATVVLDPGEEHKNVESLERIWTAALASGADRKSWFIGLGGGVVTDMTGFAAATYMRGVRWMALPTTLLAMVDASVGGKTAVDLPGAKNAVGAFWQPAAVVCDVHYLSTEPRRGYASALAEVVKTALIGDPELLALVEEHPQAVLEKKPGRVLEMVRRSVRVKARIVGLDAREQGLRACLNLGHTVGHALEAFDGYGKLRHGEAVSLGLVAALRIGERLGVTDRTLVARGVRALRELGLPVELHKHPVAGAVELIAHDKKRAGSKVRFVVARDVGHVELVDLELDALKAHATALVS